MLIILSTSDYLVNTVLNSTLSCLQISIDFICEKYQEIIQLSKDGSNAANVSTQNDELENCALNCKYLINCMEFIIKLRYLDNFNVINSSVVANLIKVINANLINLSGTCPILSIELTRLTQLLARI